MRKTIPYIASALISLVVLTSVIVLSWYEIFSHEVPSNNFASPWLAVFAAILIPQSEPAATRLRRIARSLALTAILGSLAYRVWHMSQHEVVGYLVYGAAGAVAIAAFLVLTGAGKLAFTRWQAITPPRVRAIVGTTVVATGVVAAVVLFVLQVGWRNILANLHVMLVVAYLPVVGGIAGLIYLRRTLEQRKAGAADKD